VLCQLLKVVERRQPVTTTPRTPASAAAGDVSEVYGKQKKKRKKKKFPWSLRTDLGLRFLHVLNEVVTENRVRSRH
jgi:hypothetical protein